MKVKHFMTKDVITVTSDLKITDAVDMMEANKFHRLPVIDQGKFIGLITEDVIIENSPSKVSSLSIYEMNYLFDKVLVGDLMNKNVVTTTPEVLIEKAALLMTEKDITVLPVLNEQNEVIGIITHKDIFKAMIDLTGYKDEGSRVVIETHVDRVGVIAEISKALAVANINLTHIFVNRPDDMIEITLQTSGDSSENTLATIQSLGYEVYDVTQ